jgi:hypothetical protein
MGQDRLNQKWPATQSLLAMAGLVLVAGIVATIQRGIRANQQSPAPAAGSLGSLWPMVFGGIVWLATLGVALDVVFRRQNRSTTFVLFGATIGAWSAIGRLAVRRSHIAIWPNGIAIVAITTLVAGAICWIGFLAWRALGFERPDGSSPREPDASAALPVQFRVSQVIQLSTGVAVIGDILQGTVRRGMTLAPPLNPTLEVQIRSVEYVD